MNNVRTGAAIIALLFILGIAAWRWVKPTQVVITPDSGFHEALALDGRDYMIDLRYDKMNAEQKDDANRFARKYPSGRS